MFKKIIGCEIFTNFNELTTSLEIILKNFAKYKYNFN